MSRQSKFAAFKKAKEGGGRKWQPTEDTRLYDEVSEEQYKDVVRGRLQRDDFVIDDGIQGYTDNGMDDWGEPHEECESEEDKKSKKKRNKGSKTSAKSKRMMPPPSPPKDISAYRPVISQAKEEEFLSSILSSMDSAPIPVHPRKRKPVSDFDLSSSSPVTFDPRSTNHRGSRQSSDFASSDPLDENHFPSDDMPFSPSKKMKISSHASVGITPAARKLENLEFNAPSSEGNCDDLYFDDMDMDLDIPELKSIKNEPIEKDLPAPAQHTKLSLMKSEEEEKPSLPSWLTVHTSLNVVDETLGAADYKRTESSSASVLEDDGSLHFYWLDYLENNGKVYFIGKVQDKKSNVWLSCCVGVENIERNLYVLPRIRRMENGYQTDKTPTEDDVHEDFDEMRRTVGIKSFGSKWVKRKYAFGEEGVPIGESDWMKVVYSFDEPELRGNLSSPNIARIFGANTSAFELLVLKRKIMGPCWLRIKKPDIESKGISWCKVEVTISDPKDINPFQESDTSAPKGAPPLTIMSISARTIVNHKENKREIVCVTTRTSLNSQIDDPTPPSELPCIVNTYIRPLNKFPRGMEQEIKTRKGSKITLMTNERMLLSQLLVALHKADPDIVIGHEFVGVTLDILLHRLREFKTEHYSRIGRFRRNKWLNIGRQGTNTKFLGGRLICDLASDGAKGMIASTTWSLTEMCASYLKVERQDIDPDDIVQYLDGDFLDTSRMMTFIQHCETDTYFQMAIASKVQILPLTRQLTNLAGNSWNKTLNGGRAERNEYILLHEFHRLKYICPDKTWGKKSLLAVKAETEEIDGVAPTKGKRDKYKGGLVFEPKRGLWDKFILVMDFNSLYPSIIQEYNIDFTTIERVETEDGEEKIPEPPSPDAPQGVLPRLIATLVNRRRQVKNLMKDKSITPARYLQYDIKQQALKLTANSMYGCLGFEYSRFYARPLAALTTFKGREILTHTRELAESLQLDVVYGDTDSVFVNSNVTDLAQALKTAHDFKKHVNDRYRLLEIDLDAVFKRLLLLQKKKYAAVKVEENGRTSIEVKGLDMKRREYCLLSKTVSQYVLDQILSGDDPEVVVEKIHDYLTTIGEDVRGGKIPMEEFIIHKRLGKNPEDYPDAKSQPHVQVALRMKTRGLAGRAGDVIPYIFCLGEDGQSSKTAQAAHARHPDEIRKAESENKIDYEHYLSQQLLPPIERLCEALQGTDRSRLAENLGLDPSKFRGSSGSSGNDEEIVFGTLDSRVSDEVRFKNLKQLLVSCTGCDGQMEFEPVHVRENSILNSTGLKYKLENRCLAITKAGCDVTILHAVFEHAR
ncbi:hypothetical protein Clacol_009887 [Clathrus columnatus]|uniref:DNA polymerase n=1 Tax=Clathrus columnatus TaxID=1419009 RepID=A0AAV5AS79_9AGAM|nr:hypothetical protein Clacol_009887 [Clathrus columnatus]